MSEQFKAWCNCQKVGKLCIVIKILYKRQPEKGVLQNVSEQKRYEAGEVEQTGQG